MRELLDEYHNNAYDDFTALLESELSDERLVDCVDSTSAENVMASFVCLQAELLGEVYKVGSHHYDWVHSSCLGCLAERAQSVLSHTTCTRELDGASSGNSPGKAGIWSPGLGKGTGKSQAARYDPARYGSQKGKGKGKGKWKGK